jgi:hypothetical protein
MSGGFHLGQTTLLKRDYPAPVQCTTSFAQCLAERPHVVIRFRGRQLLVLALQLVSSLCVVFYGQSLLEIACTLVRARA